MALPKAVALLVLSLLFAGLFIRKKLSPHRLPLPPGPKGLPLLGNALQINKNEPWLTYKTWNEQYGEIVSCKLLGQVHIILNSERVARALLDQRSVLYSGRPVIQTSKLFGIDFNTAHLSADNPAWKSHRKIFQQTLGSIAVPRYHDSLVEKARDLASRLLHSPKDFRSHVDAYSASIIMSITYGYNVIPMNDPFVTPLQEVIDIIINTSPEKAVLLNIFPQLAYLPPWFPGAGLLRMARRCQELSPKVRDAPFQYVKDCLSKNIDNDSMVAQLLKDETVPAEERAAYEQNIKDCATTSFIAGTDSTRAVLSSLILALMLFPEVQERAHAVIDSAVGRGRLPNFNDLASLHYFEALVRETMRWASLVPLGIPRMATKDDVFEQCFIPKGSFIIVNSWGMARNEELFPDARTFKPERHLDADGHILPDDHAGLNYGYGRRVCSGRYLANASTWLGAATMVAVFKFSKPIGPAGYEMDVVPRFAAGVARRPLEFPCHIAPRFEGAEELLN